MKEQNVFQAIILLLAIGCVVPHVYGQGGDARLPGSTPRTRPKPTPKPVVKDEPVVPPPPSTRAPANVPPIAFNQLITAGLDPQTSGQIKVGIYYDEYTLKATDADIFTMFLQTPNPGLTVQVYDAAGRGLPTLRDPRSGEFKLDTQGGTLPGAGEYRLRVVGVVPEATGAIGYTLRVNRTGLTETGYQERLQSIIAAFNAPETKNVDETIAKLEQLVNDDDNQPGGYELLGVIYLYHRNDPTKAGAAMEKSIKLKGAAVFRVTYDPVLGRRPTKKPDGQYDWVESKNAWLRVQPDHLVLADVSNEQEPVFSLAGNQIKEVTVVKTGTLSTISVKTPVQAKGYAFCPGTKGQGETDLILRMLRTYVPPRL